MQYKFNFAKNKMDKSANKTHYMCVNSIKREITYAYKYDYIEVSRTFMPPNLLHW
jgi:hypothetical protein